MRRLPDLLLSQLEVICIFLQEQRRFLFILLLQYLPPIHYTSTIKDLIIGSSNNHVTLNCAGTGFSSIIGTSIDVSGCCPATGQNETFHIAFLPSF